MVYWSWAENRKWSGLIPPGVFFSLAFLMKPMMFPYPLGMLGLSTTVAIFANVFQKNQWTWRRFVLGMLLLWCIALVPIAIHLGFFWDRIIAYITEVAFASDYYKIKDKGAVWYFHWLGYSGVWHLSAMKTIFVLTIIASALTRAIPSTRKFAPGPEWYSMAFLTLGAFGGIAINQVNQPFFGMTFQLMAVATALLAFAHFFFHSKIFWVGPMTMLIFGIYWFPVVWSRQFLLPIVGVGCFLLIYCFAFKFPIARTVGFLSSGLLALFCWNVTMVSPFHNYMKTTREANGSEGVRWRMEGPSKLYDLLCPEMRENFPPLVWFSNYAWVDANTVGWEAAKRGISWKMYNSVDLDLGGRKITDMVDIFVVSEPGVLGQLETPHFETAKNLEETLKADSRFRRIGAVSDPHGKQMTVYSRISQSEK
jgi:hypothetical protein